MNLEKLLSVLQNATAYQLYRLHSVIGDMLDDPAKSTAVKQRLVPDMKLSFFDERENRLIPAQLLQVRRSRVTVRDLETGKKWTVPLYMLNIDHVTELPQQPSKTISRLNLKKGDRVGFTARDGRPLYGVVIKLNPKRAKINTAEGIWNVPYTMLYSILDAESGDPRVLSVDQD